MTRVQTARHDVHVGGKTTYLDFSARGTLQFPRVGTLRPQITLHLNLGPKQMGFVRIVAFVFQCHRDRRVVLPKADKVLQFGCTASLLTRRAYVWW